MSAAETGGLAPLGVFDSGVGGLSVVRELLAQLPGHPLLYLADQPMRLTGSAGWPRFAACLRASPASCWPRARG